MTAPNWTRSRIRRQHLINLGIPINLDEVLPKSTAKPLPALQITTRPMSAPPGPRSTGHMPASSTSSRAGTPRSGTPQPSTRGIAASQLRLGPQPEVDEAHIADLLAMDPGKYFQCLLHTCSKSMRADSLTLLPLSTLEAYLQQLKQQTVQASSLLTYLLQTRDAFQQDSETYNKLIGELVGQAQKTAGKGRGSTPVRKGSTRV
jgi:hypothetical protein